MARIPDEVVERVKREVSLARLVELAGVELARQGKDLVGCCPFHEDRSPSLVVSPEKNLWHCMGACQTGGSPIDWTMRCEGVSFRHAVELLRDGVAPSAPRDGRLVRSTVKKLPSPLQAGADERELMERVVAFYAHALKESPHALGYLEGRGLVHPELLERFRLGYANRTLGYRLPAKNRKAGEQLRGSLQRLGILRESGHEHLSGSLVIPVCDEHGTTVQLYGRKIRVGLRTGTALHLYLPGPRRGVFNREALGAADGEVIVCESLIDALTFWVHGVRNVTASWGAEGFTDEHHAALKQAGVRRVLIAYDRDDAGDHGASRLAERLGGDGVECLRVLFGFEQDANSFACEVDDPAGALAEVLRHAVWMGASAPPSRPAPVVPIQQESPADSPASAPVPGEQHSGEEKNTEQEDDERPADGAVDGVEGVVDGAAPAVVGNLADVRHQGAINVALTVFAVAVSAPVVEEIFFRGLLYRSLRNRLSIVPAVLIAGVLFGFVHITSYPLDTLPVKAAFGVIACLLYERTGSLLPGIGLHALIDASAVVVALTGSDLIVIACSVLVVVVVIVGGWIGRVAGRRRADPCPVAFAESSSSTLPGVRHRV